MNKFLPLIFILFSTFFMSAQNRPYDDDVVDYKKVEMQPAYPDGYNEFIKFLGKNLIIPEDVEFNGILKISFIIEKNGTISSVSVDREIWNGVITEVTRVLGLSKRWYPGEEGGKKVRVFHEIPIKIYN